MIRYMTYVVINVAMAVVVSVTAMYNFRMSVVTGDVLRGVSVPMSVLGGREGDEGSETQHLKYRQNIIFIFLNFELIFFHLNLILIV